MNIKRKNKIITKSHIMVQKMQVLQLYAFITEQVSQWQKKKKSERNQVVIEA